MCKECYNNIIDDPETCLVLSYVENVISISYIEKGLSKPIMSIIKKIKILRKKGTHGENCGKKVGVDGIKKTNRHHDRYHDNDVLQNTRELCNNCHSDFHNIERREKCEKLGLECPKCHSKYFRRERVSGEQSQMGGAQSPNGKIWFGDSKFNQTYGNQSYLGTFNTDAHHTLTLCYNGRPCINLYIIDFNSNHIEATFPNGDTLHLMR
jgi:Zn finger protein HypA/HybF involved in hydrogenase expression